SKSKLTKKLNPTNIIIPKMAIAVPIQKLNVGLFFKKKNAPTPTQTGERFVSNVACVAVDSCIAMFQTATSAAKMTPHKTVSNKIFKDGIFSFPVKTVKGTNKAAAIAIL